MDKFMLALQIIFVMVAIVGFVMSIYKNIILIYNQSKINMLHRAFDDLCNKLKVDSLDEEKSLCEVVADNE